MMERMIKSTAVARRGIWPAHPRQLAPIRLELRRWLAPLEMTGEAQEDIVLAANEAAANSVEHAYPEATEDDTVELTFWTGPDAVYIQIIDHGLWQTPPTEPIERGRGIPMMHRLAESVLIRHGPDGTNVLLRCPLG
jgi:serine/threonine-protein kinase RsbW